MADDLNLNLKQSDNEQRSIGEQMGVIDVTPFSSIQPQPPEQPNSSDQGNQNND